MLQTQAPDTDCTVTGRLQILESKINTVQHVEETICPQYCVPALWADLQTNWSDLHRELVCNIGETLQVCVLEALQEEGQVCSYS